MRTCVCEAPGKLEYRNSAPPTLSSGHAILKVRRVGICGTDLHAFLGTQPYFSYPRILGHELACDMVESDGTLDGIKPGDPVGTIPYFSCGRCYACRCGKPNCCARLQVLGVHIDGGLSTFISVPNSAIFTARGLNYEMLALVEPLAVAAHAVKRASAGEGLFAMVVGAGPIGLALMEFLHLAGARVIALEVNPNRISFCRQFGKADFVLDPSMDRLHDQLMEITRGDMIGILMDATGNLKAINDSFPFVAHGGMYVLVGLQRGNIEVNHPEFHKREAALLSSRNATKEDFQFVTRMIEERKIDPEIYLSRRIVFDDLKIEFPSLVDPSAGVIKAMVVLD